MGKSAPPSLGFLAVPRNFIMPSILHRCHRGLVNVRSGAVACHLRISFTGLKSSAEPFSHFFRKILTMNPNGILPEKSPDQSQANHLRVEPFSWCFSHVIRFVFRLDY